MKDDLIYEEQYCGNKRCYTKVEAQTALNSLKYTHYISTPETGKRRRKIKHRPIRKYYCDQCNHWHLTSKEFRHE